MKSKNEYNYRKKTSSESADDIRNLFHSELPPAPADEWFTKKVMNRLPEKRYRTPLSLPEKLCYIIGIFMLIAGWGSSFAFTMTHGLTATTLTIAAVLPVVTFVCICVFAIPAIRKSI